MEGFIMGMGWGGGGGMGGGGGGKGSGGGGGGKGGGQTTFYKFNAGTDLDAFTLNLARSSDAVLYTTGDPGSVPEPISWALMLGGFGTIGGLMRSRGKAAVYFG